MNNLLALHLKRFGVQRVFGRIFRVRSRVRVAALTAVMALALVPLSTSAGITSFTGTFTGDDEVFSTSFTLAVDSVVSARTFSFGGGVNGNGDTIPPGGFPPILSLFFATGTQDLLQLAVGSSNDCSNPDAGQKDPTSGFCWDAFFTTTLPAGSYTVAISQDGNLPNGPGFADGFSETGNPNYTGTDYLGDGSKSFILVTTEQRTGNWAFDLTIPSQGSVPEPATIALLGMGLSGLAYTRRRRQSTPE